MACMGCDTTSRCADCEVSYSYDSAIAAADKVAEAEQKVFELQCIAQERFLSLRAIAKTEHLTSLFKRFMGVDSNVFKVHVWNAECEDDITGSPSTIIIATQRVDCALAAHVQTFWDNRVVSLVETKWNLTTGFEYTFTVEDPDEQLAAWRRRGKGGSNGTR